MSRGYPPSRPPADDPMLPPGDGALLCGLLGGGNPPGVGAWPKLWPVFGVWRPSDRSEDCESVDCWDDSSCNGTPSGPVVVVEVLMAGDTPPPEFDEGGIEELGGP